MRPESTSRTRLRVVIPRYANGRRWRRANLPEPRPDEESGDDSDAVDDAASSCHPYSLAVNGFVEAVRHSGQPPVDLDHDQLFAQAAPMLEALRERARARRASASAVRRAAVTTLSQSSSDRTVRAVRTTGADVVDPSDRGLAWGMARGNVETIRAERAVEQLAAEATGRAAELGATMCGSDPKLAELAGTRLRELMGQVLEYMQYAPDLEPRSRAQEAVHRLNHQMWALRKRTKVLPRRYWGWAPLISAVLKPGTFLGVLWCLASERPTMAFVVFVLGRGLSLLLPSAYGAETFYGSRFSWRVSVYGHFGDAVGLLCVAAYLVRYDRTFWAGAIAFSAVAMLCGTIIRLAAVHAADFVVRLSIERIARDGFMAAALVLEALLQRSGGPALIPGTGVPMIVVAGVGPAVYAVIEAWRVRRRARLNDLRRAQLSPAGRLADRYLELHPAIEEPRFHSRRAAM